MVFYCCVPQCKSKQIKECGLHFHKFPENKLMVTRWVRAIRSGKKPTKFTRICSLHFCENNYKPTVHSDTRRYLKPSAIPNKNLPLIPNRRQLSNVERLPPKPREMELNTEPVETISGTVERENQELSVDPPPTPQTYSAPTREVSTQTFVPMKLSLFYDCLTNEQFNRYTGLYRDRFDVLFAFLNETAPSKFDVYLAKRDQLILTLSKYRQNLLFSIIGDMYGLNLLTTRKIIVHWTRVMNAAFKAVDWWAFRYQNPDKYTVILDCSEIKTNQSRANPEFNQALFSQYKNQNTLKYLLGIDEKGTVIYCSDAYCGSVSDRYIVGDCGILNKLKDGDIVLADRGFDVSDILEGIGVVLNISPFLRNKSQLTLHEVLETRRIANRRILVERVIGLGKFNKILCHTFPSHLWKHANEVIYVSNMLINFKRGIL